jgi:hypothetical protein
VPKRVLPWAIAFCVGLAFGYLFWGEHARRAEADFVDQLGAVLGDLREQNRLMQAVLAESERKTAASLAVCEKAQVKLQAKLEGCLFGKADEHPIDDDDTDTPPPRSGTAPVVETYSYPVPVPGAAPPPDAKQPKAPPPKVLEPAAK